MRTGYQYRNPEMHIVYVTSSLDTLSSTLRRDKKKLTKQNLGQFLSRMVENSESLTF